MSKQIVCTTIVDMTHSTIKLMFVYVVSVSKTGSSRAPILSFAMQCKMTIKNILHYETESYFILTRTTVCQFPV